MGNEGTVSALNVQSESNSVYHLSIQLHAHVRDVEKALFLQTKQMFSQWSPGLQNVSRLEVSSIASKTLIGWFRCV